jgi:hypothetical protein
VNRHLLYSMITLWMCHSSVGNASGFNRVLTCTSPKGGETVETEIDVFAHKSVIEGTDYQGFIAVQKSDSQGKQTKSGELATVVMKKTEVAARVVGKSCSDCLTIDSKGNLTYKGKTGKEEVDCKVFLPNAKEEFIIETDSP